MPERPEERRRSDRIPLRRAVSLHWQERGAACAENTYTLTISLYGCAIANGSHLRPGAEIRVRRDGREMAGRVVYNLKDSSKEYIELGIGFDAPGDEFWDYAF